jgi:hypothetical protein
MESELKARAKREVAELDTYNYPDEVWLAGYAAGAADKAEEIAAAIARAEAR